MGTGRRKAPAKFGFSGFVYRLAAFLLVMTLVSFYSLSGLLARYSASGTGEDTGRVAYFGNLMLTQAGTEEQLSLLPGVDITKDPRLSMTKSEVAVRVYLKLELGGGWSASGNSSFRFLTNPADPATAVMEWSLEPQWKFEKQEGNVYTFAYTEDLAPGTALENVRIIAGGVIKVSENVPFSDYYDSIDTEALKLEISAAAKQID